MIGGADHPSRRAGAAQAAPEGTAGAQQIEQRVQHLAQHRRPPDRAAGSNGSIHANSASVTSVAYRPPVRRY